MNDETIQKEIERIRLDLEELFKTVHEDYLRDKSRYNMGVMVGIGYASRELERVARNNDEN